MKTKQPHLGRIALVLFVVIMAFFVIGCGSSDSATADGGSSSASSNANDVNSVSDDELVDSLYIDETDDVVIGEMI
jgi:hypothetical protein